MSPNDYDLDLVELYRRSTGRLETAEVFDEKAFHALKHYLCAKAEALKAEHVVSKQILECLRSTAQIIRTQSNSVPAAKANLKLANEFEMLLDLIIIGEGCNDRTLGVPRII